MRIGILSDPHLGFSRYTKVNDKGVNQREADFYRSFITAVENLCNADVDAILDLGDLADNPHPKKRAVQCLIETINATGLPWWSVNGNHTLVRHSTDIHLYDVLEHHCDRFVGIREASWVERLRAFLIPYGSSEEIKAGLHDAEAHSGAWVGGHWACDDVLPDGHDIKTTDLPEGSPVICGHFHGRTVPYPTVAGKVSLKTMGATGPPVYIGATDRKTWNDWNSPAGAAVYDTDARTLTFIDHPVRPWLPIVATPNDYLDILSEELGGRDDMPIVRLDITATREEYAALDENKARAIASNTLDFTIRRVGTEEEPTSTEAPTPTSLKDSWRSQVKGASMPKGVKRVEVERIGVDALAGVGVAA